MMGVNIVIPITRPPPHPEEKFERVRALPDNDWKAALAKVVEGYGELLALGGPGTPLFVAGAKDEDRLDLGGFLGKVLGRKADMAVLERVPEGKLATLLKVRTALDPSRELLVLPGDRIVRSDLHKWIAYTREKPGDSPNGIVSVIGRVGDPAAVVTATAKFGLVERVRGLREGRLGDGAAAVPLVATGLCWFPQTLRFLELADEFVAQVGAKYAELAEVVEVCERYIDRGLPITTSFAREVEYVCSSCPGVLRYERGRRRFVLENLAFDFEGRARIP